MILSSLKTKNKTNLPLPQIQDGKTIADQKHCWTFQQFFHKYWQKITKMRRSRSQMFFKIVVLKNFANFTGKHLCWSLFLIMLQDKACKEETQTQVFSCIFAKYFRTPFFTEHLWWLLLKNIPPTEKHSSGS